MSKFIFNPRLIIAVTIRVSDGKGRLFFNRYLTESLKYDVNDSVQKYQSYEAIVLTVFCLHS